MQLGDFASDDDVTLRSQNVDNVLQRFGDTVRCFIENLGARRGLDVLQGIAALAAFGREKTAEAEGIGGQSAGHQARQES